MIVIWWDAGRHDGSGCRLYHSREAMNGYLANRARTVPPTKLTGESSDVAIHSKPLAEYCFEVADAWLAERNKRMESDMDWAEIVDGCYLLGGRSFRRKSSEQL